MSTTSSARVAFESLFTQEQVNERERDRDRDRAVHICDRILTREAVRLVKSTGARGNIFPILNRLAAFKNGRPVECDLRGERPQDISLVLGLELISLNSSRFFQLNVTVDPSRHNGRIVNWREPAEL
jgi:hypothetical protein